LEGRPKADKETKESNARGVPLGQVAVFESKKHGVPASHKKNEDRDHKKDGSLKGKEEGRGEEGKRGWLV
jgi:hypothetical protein